MQRFNSIVAIKTGCVDCEPGNKSPIYALKRCMYHYKKHSSDARQDRVRERRLVNEERQHNLDIWFEAIAKNECDEYGTTCWACNAFIPKKYIRAAIAHILPKRQGYGFPSVSTHPYNYLILGSGCGCHQQYDKSWDDASRMPIFKLAKDRFRLFVNSISLDEKSKVPIQFYE